jgi:hypothetical protein
MVVCVIGQSSGTRNCALLTPAMRAGSEYKMRDRFRALQTSGSAMGVECGPSRGQDQTASSRRKRASRDTNQMRPAYPGRLFSPASANHTVGI